MSRSSSEGLRELAAEAQARAREDEAERELAARRWAPCCEADGPRILAAPAPFLFMQRSDWRLRLLLVDGRVQIRLPAVPVEERNPCE